MNPLTALGLGLMFPHPFEKVLQSLGNVPTYKPVIPEVIWEENN